MNDNIIGDISFWGIFAIFGLISLLIAIQIERVTPLYPQAIEIHEIVE